MIKRILLMIGLLAMMAMPSWAVVSSTISQNKYSCDSTTTSWAYTFPIIGTSGSDIQVWTIDAFGNPTQQTSNFSVNTVTQHVTYPVSGTACATGNTILLMRVEPFTQLVAASNQGPAPSPVVMTMSDKLTMLAQQIEAQMNRAVLAPIGSTSSAGYALPSPLANAYVGWDPTGTFLININAAQNLTPTASPTFVELTLTGLSGILKSSGASGISAANADVDYSVPNGVETFTNKTYDTGGTGNTFKVAGTTLGATGVTGSGVLPLVTGIKGNSGYMASASGTPSANNCAKWDTNGNLVDNGSTCSGGSGMTYPSSAGFAVSDTTKWLTSVSASGGLMSANINWTDINKLSPINHGGINWSELNANGSLNSGGVNWADINRLATINSGGINWADINRIATMNSGGINWADLNRLATINTTGINWQNFLLNASGTYYAPPTSASAILAGNGSGGFSNVTAGKGISYTGATLTANATPILGVHNTLTQSIGTTTWTQRTFNTVDEDSGGYWSSNTFTPLVAGWYLVNYMDSAGLAISYAFNIAIYKNGSLVSEAQGFGGSGGNGTMSASASSVIQMNGSTDYIQFYVYVGNATTIPASGGSSYASIIRVY